MEQLSWKKHYSKNLTYLNILNTYIKATLSEKNISLGKWNKTI